MAMAGCGSALPLKVTNTASEPHNLIHLAIWVPRRKNAPFDVNHSPTFGGVALALGIGTGSLACRHEKGDTWAGVGQRPGRTSP